MKITTLFGLLLLVLLESCSYQQNDKSGSYDAMKTEKRNQYDNFKFKSADFVAFYNKFISDSIFQISRVKFPIKGHYADFGGEQNWNKENWPMMKWDLREEIKETEDSVSIEQSDNRLFFGSYGRDCGFSFEMTFEKIKGEWYLTYRQENNY